MKRFIILLLCFSLLFCSCSQKQENKEDVVGNIYIPNTGINKNFVQSDENAKYEQIGPDGKFVYGSTYWADYRCNLSSVDSLSTNTIIYGHSSYKDKPEDEQSFSNLYYYVCDKNGDNSSNQGYFFLRNNPYIELTINGEKAIFQIFSVFYANVDIDLNTDTDFKYVEGTKNPFYFWWVPQADDPNQEKEKREEDLKNFIEAAKIRSEYIIDLDVTPDDKFLTLQTCTGKYNGHIYGLEGSNYQEYRFVIMAKLLQGVTEIPSKCNTQMIVNPNPLRT